MKRTGLFFILSACLASLSNAQESRAIRELQTKLRIYNQEDTNRAKILDDLAWEYSYFDFKKSNDYCRKELHLSEKINYPDGEAKAYSTMGNNFRALSQFDSAHYYLELALMIRKKQNRKDRISAALVNIANIYYWEKNYSKAILTYNEGARIAKEVDFKKGVLVAYTNLADVYRAVGIFDKAIQTLNSALDVNRILKDSLQDAYLYTTLASLLDQMNNANAAISNGRKALRALATHPDIILKSNIFNNMGNYYRELGQPDSARVFYLRALETETEIQDSSGIGVTKNGLGALDLVQKKYDESLVYSESAQSIARSIHDTLLLYQTSLVVADAYIAKKNYLKALGIVREASQLAGKMNMLKGLYESYTMLATIYKALSMYKESTDCLEKAISYRDAVLSDKTNKTSAALNIEFDVYGKEKEIELLNKASELNEVELSKQKAARVFTTWIAALFALIGLVVIFFYRRIKKASDIIQLQRKKVEQQNSEISFQKTLIEAKQRDIISSINYAQRIQSAILTGEEVWNKISKQHFILYHPRDIVSGDFYWAHILPNGRAVFTLADCTGHGVPGGFMSMLGNSFLNELVVENKLFKADEILNRLREKVIHSLEQQGEILQKDGMDMALCVWNKMDNSLEFAGANSNMYLIRNGELTTLKGDKMPIGSYLEENAAFSSKKLTLQPNDILYLVTDGFADQFGGTQGKKFKYKHLEEILVQASSLPFEAQKEHLNTIFIEWRDHYEQTDDMSFIGIKI